MTLTPEEAERLFCIARDLLSEPRLADRANKLTAEACHLAGKRQMMTMSALRYLAARGHKEAQGFLDALEVSVCQAAAPQAPQFGWLKVATGFATGTSLGFLRSSVRSPEFPGIIDNCLRRGSARKTELSALSDRLQQKGAATVILILDACRDNPFAVKGKRAIGMTRGLTRMDPAEGMFVLFSAGQGQSALDRLSDTDANPNSVFTRTLLVEMETPGQSMVQIAKKTQSKVRELAAKVDHVQVPAYYDQIVGDLYLSPEGATSAGSLAKLEEGGGESVLPPQEQKVAALQAPQPLTSFMRSNADWTVNVSLPEAATQFGYRIGDQGSFIDAGFIDALDQRTGQRMPKTYFELPPDQGKTKLYVTWRDRRGEQADIVTINFDPQAALAESEKKILEVLWTAWIDFRDWNGAMLVYFSHLITYRCAIQEVRYGYNGGTIDQIYKLPPCNILDPNSVPEDAKIYMKAPAKTKSMQVQLTYLDGTQSPVRSFNAPH